MPLKPFKMFCSILVLSSGLISCSKENNVVYKTDSFKPEGITVQNEDKSIFRLEDLRELGPGGEFKFDGLKDTDLTANPVLTTVQSRCRENGMPATVFAEFKFNNRSKVSVLEILPEDLLVSVRGEVMECDFTFEFQNAVSSRHTEVLTGIRIKDFGEYSNFSPTIIQDGRAVYARSLEEIVPTAQVGSVRLSCRDASVFFVQSVASFSLKDFDLSRPDVQQNLKSSEQRCRLLVTHEGTRQISAFFNLRFPVGAPVVRGIVQPLPATKEFNNPLVIKLAISNPNTYPIKVRIAKKDRTRFLFKPVYEQVGRIYLGRFHRVLFEWVPTSPAEIKGTDIFIEVPAETEIIVDGFARDHMTCNFGATINLYGVDTSGTFNGFAGTPGWGKIIKYVGTNYSYELNSRIMIDAGASDWLEQKVIMDGTEHSTRSDFPYWSLPSTEILKWNFNRVPDFINTPSVDVADFCVYP